MFFLPHCHPDHFTAWCTKRSCKDAALKDYLCRTPDFGVYFARQIAMRQADQTWLLNLPLAKKMTIRLSEKISLTVFRSNHAGKQYVDIENYCYLLDYAGRKVFIIGDGDYDAAYFAQMLEGETIEVAFINPLFINLTEGREVITQALKPARVIVYHIPFADRDRGFRKLVKTDIEKNQGSLPPIDILWDELQEISF